MGVSGSLPDLPDSTQKSRTIMMSESHKAAFARCLRSNVRNYEPLVLERSWTHGHDAILAFSLLGVDSAIASEPEEER